MGRLLNFAVLRLMPDPARGEAINIGIVVFLDRDLDVRIGEVLTRARILFPGLTVESLREGVSILKRLGSVSLSTGERHSALRTIGMFTLGELGSFEVDDGRFNYEERVTTLLKLFSSGVKAHIRHRPATRLVTEVRKAFRSEKVLAAVGDAGALEEHKIVPDWPIPNRPSIRADLALRNGITRVCQIVQMELEDDGPPPNVLFAGVVTLDVAQHVADAKQTVFAYRAAGPTARIDEALAIAKLHASELIDWEVKAQREAFMHEWISAAKNISDRQLQI